MLTRYFGHNGLVSRTHTGPENDATFLELAVQFDEFSELITAPTPYQQLRAAAYPPIGDQLDALWKGGAAAEEMLAQIHAVKARHPKGA